MRFFAKGLKNEFEIALVNEPSVFEPLKFYCINTRVNMQSIAILKIIEERRGEKEHE